MTRGLLPSGQQSSSELLYAAEWRQKAAIWAGVDLENTSSGQLRVHDRRLRLRADLTNLPTRATDYGSAVNLSQAVVRGALTLTPASMSCVNMTSRPDAIRCTNYWQVDDTTERGVTVFLQDSGQRVTLFTCMRTSRSSAFGSGAC